MPTAADRNRQRLGVFLTQRRKESGYSTREALSEASSVGVSTIGKAENGERITVSRLNAITLFLDCVDEAEAILNGWNPYGESTEDTDDTEPNALVDTLLALRRLVGERDFDSAVRQVQQTRDLERRHA